MRTISAKFVEIPVSDIMRGIDLLVPSRIMFSGFHCEELKGDIVQRVLARAGTLFL